MTLLSRIAGYLRDMVVAQLLGTGMEMDAWRVAFQLPNTFRRLVGEGNLSAAFIPIFSRIGEERSSSELWLLARRFHTAMAVLLGGLTVAGIILSPVLVTIFAAGYADIPGKLELTVLLTRLAFPYLFFVGLAGVLMAVLNARGYFAIPAFTPVLFNLSVIASATLFAGWLVSPVIAIVGGALVGGLLQWSFQIPFARRIGMRLRPGWRLQDPDLGRIARLMTPGMFGVGIVQVNIFVGTFLASFLAEGSVSSLYYASRLNELALGLFGVSVATVALPLMARQAAVGSHIELRRTLGYTLRLVSTIALPATVGLIVLRTEIVSVLFQRGMFDAESTRLTASTLWAYSLGLLAIATVRIVAPCFFSLQDTRTPVVVAGGSLVVNIVASLLLIKPLAHSGIALANSIAAYCNAVWLLCLLRRRLGGIEGRELLTSMLRHAIGAAMMAGAVVALRGAIPSVGEPLWARGFALAGTIVAGILVYTGVLKVLRAPELRDLAALFSIRSRD